MSARALRRLAAALAQCDKLAMALKKYGEHNCDCIKYITDDKECDCGLDALLKECGTPQLTQQLGRKNDR